MELKIIRSGSSLVDLDISRKLPLDCMTSSLFTTKSNGKSVVLYFMAFSNTARSSVVKMRLALLGRGGEFGLTIPWYWVLSSSQVSLANSMYSSNRKQSLSCLHLSDPRTGIPIENRKSIVLGMIDCKCFSMNRLDGIVGLTRYKLITWV